MEDSMDSCRSSLDSDVSPLAEQLPQKSFARHATPATIIVTTSPPPPPPPPPNNTSSAILGQVVADRRLASHLERPRTALRVRPRHRHCRQGSSSLYSRAYIGLGSCRLRSSLHVDHIAFFHLHDSPLSSGSSGLDTSACLQELSQLLPSRRRRHEQPSNGLGPPDSLP
jgi:hypothetical protein